MDVTRSAAFFQIQSSQHEICLSSTIVHPFRSRLIFLPSDIKLFAGHHSACSLKASGIPYPTIQQALSEFKCIRASCTDSPESFSARSYEIRVRGFGRCIQRAVATQQQERDQQLQRLDLRLPSACTISKIWCCKDRPKMLGHQRSYTSPRD